MYLSQYLVEANFKKQVYCLGLFSFRLWAAVTSTKPNNLNIINARCEMTSTKKSLDRVNVKMRGPVFLAYFASILKYSLRAAVTMGGLNVPPQL